MVLLLLNAGERRYALDTADVVEVVPAVELKPSPHASGPVAGGFDYRGGVVPVLDLCRLVEQRPCRRRLSTRIIVIETPDADGSPRRLGLMAERVTETVKVAETDLQPADAQADEPLYLGKLLAVGADTVRCLRTDRLLPEDLRRSLFADPAEPM